MKMDSELECSGWCSTILVLWTPSWWWKHGSTEPWHGPTPCFEANRAQRLWHEGFHFWRDRVSARKKISKFRGSRILVTGLENIFLSKESHSRDKTIFDTVSLDLLPPKHDLGEAESTSQAVRQDQKFFGIYRIESISIESTGGLLLFSESMIQPIQDKRFKLPL